MPHDLGKLPLPLIDQVPPFNWDNYKDIDDKYTEYEFEGVDSKGNPIMKKKSNQKEEVDGESPGEGEIERGGDDRDGEEGDAEEIKGEGEEDVGEAVVGENESNEGENPDREEEGKVRNEYHDGEEGNSSGKENGKEMKGADDGSPSPDS
jgi:hypothetical protein